MDNGFWKMLDEMVSTHAIVIDRPKSSRHPHFSHIVYELDYGYLEGTSSMDGGGIDVWVGSLGVKKVCAVICTVDCMKNDSEIKLLIGCTKEEMQYVERFHNSSEYMKGLLIER